MHDAGREDRLTATSICAEVWPEAPAATVAFWDAPCARVIFGAGAVGRLGALVAEHVTGKILVVTDPGIRDSGHLSRVRASLEQAGLAVAVFDAVRENPTTLDVDHCLEVARAEKVDGLVGLGGGSSMDTAKGCNFLLTNGGEMRDYWGVGKASKPMLPFVAVPTTAGTGSECQSFALIAERGTHTKMACGDKKAAAVLAVLDPLLTLTQPRPVAAQTAIDAVAHAVETAVTTKRNDVSAAYSRLAFLLLERGIPTVLEDPDDLLARSQVQLGAAYAGTAIENSMLGAAHAAANPLTAHFDVVHGTAVGVMLPGVVRLNASDPDARAGYSTLGGSHLDARLDALLELAGLRKPLRELGVEQSLIPQMAEEAAAQWTAQFNPVPVTASDFERLYRQAW
ncbi:iron-containing alcohol dehydrogenase [soil metagenome]